MTFNKMMSYIEWQVIMCIQDDIMYIMIYVKCVYLTKIMYNNQMCMCVECE